MPEIEVKPLAWPIPQAAKRAGFGETRFRELLNAGEVGFVENGDRKLERFSIRRNRFGIHNGWLL